jgi:hypothetical protein
MTQGHRHEPDADPSAPEPISPPKLYSVEYNVDGISDGIPGDWTIFSAHENLLDAIRAASEFMELAKNALGVARVEKTADALIEPWIRIMEQRNIALVAWVDNGHLRMEQDFAGDFYPPELPR